MDPSIIGYIRRSKSDYSENIIV